MNGITTRKNKISKKKLIIRIVLTILILFAVAIVSSLIINFYVQASTKHMILSPEDAAAIDADCIIVLGAGVRDDGSLSDMLHDRLQRGVELYFAGASDKLLMSGDHGRVDYDEVNAMKSYAVENSVPSENVFMDHAGFSTYESMYRAKAIFEAKKIIIVTQGYHLPRALYIARSFGFEAYGVDADLRPYAGQDYRDAREVVARVKDFFTSVIKPKPTYLGDVIPISGDGNATNDKEYA